MNRFTVARELSCSIICCLTAGSGSKARSANRGNTRPLVVSYPTDTDTSYIIFACTNLCNPMELFVYLTSRSNCERLSSIDRSSNVGLGFWGAFSCCCWKTLSKENEWIDCSFKKANKEDEKSFSKRTDVESSERNPTKKKRRK